VQPKIEVVLALQVEARLREDVLHDHRPARTLPFTIRRFRRRRLQPLGQLEKVLPHRRVVGLRTAAVEARLHPVSYSRLSCVLARASEQYCWCCWASCEIIFVKSRHLVMASKYIYSVSGGCRRSPRASSIFSAVWLCGH